MTNFCVGRHPLPACALNGRPHLRLENAEADRRVSGSFSDTFDGGDTLTETFDVPVCEP